MQSCMRQEFQEFWPLFCIKNIFVEEGTCKYVQEGKRVRDGSKTTEKANRR